MAHYPHIFTVNRLRLEAHLGFYDEERARQQPIEVELRLYFPAAQECLASDRGAFLDYVRLTDAIAEKVASGQYRLIEYLASGLFAVARRIVDGYGADIRLWLKLTKCASPVANLQAGASFVISDLPAGATFPPIG